MMPRYQVNFMIKDWVQISVDADDEQEARSRASKKLDKAYDKYGIEYVDGKTICLGCLNESEIDTN